MTCGGHLIEKNRQLLKRSVGEVVTDFIPISVFINAKFQNRYKFSVDVWWKTYFLCNDLESSNWNNHFD